MCFSFAIVLIVVAALTSSTSAMPADDGSLISALNAWSAQCSTLCIKDSQCQGRLKGYCTPLFCQVSRVSDSTSVQYGRWH
ncbi:hypothetical protein EDB19DRAFT_1728803, partial [Suillus lakei]